MIKPEALIRGLELDEIAKALPLYPPLTDNGLDASISDLYPALSKKELDYVYRRYNGTMRLK